MFLVKGFSRIDTGANMLCNWFICKFCSIAITSVLYTRLQFNSLQQLFNGSQSSIQHTTWVVFNTQLFNTPTCFHICPSYRNHPTSGNQEYPFILQCILQCNFFSQKKRMYFGYFMSECPTTIWKVFSLE